MSVKSPSLTPNLPRSCTWTNELTLLQLKVLKCVNKRCNAVVKQLLEKRADRKLQEIKIFLKSSISLLEEGTQERAELQDILNKIDISAACSALFIQNTSFKAASLLEDPFTDLRRKSPNAFDKIIDNTPASSFKQELLTSLKLDWIQDMNEIEFSHLDSSFASHILIPPEPLYGSLPLSHFQIPEKYMDIGFYGFAEDVAKDFGILKNPQAMVVKLDWYENFIGRLCENSCEYEAIGIIHSILQLDPEESIQRFSESKLRLIETVYDVLYNSGHVEMAFKFLYSTRSQPFFSTKYAAALCDFRLALANSRINPSPESSAELSQAHQLFLSVSKEESSMEKQCLQNL